MKAASFKAGTVSNELAAHIDLMPTILDACGVASPKDVKIDGHSLLPGLAGQAPAAERSIVIQTHRGDQPQRYHHFMIRKGDWKLMHASGFGREQFSGEPKFELYNLATDPGENDNRFPAEALIAKELKQAYDSWFDDVSATRPNNYAPPRIHVGNTAEPATMLTRQDWRGGSWHPNSIGHWLLHVDAAGDYRVRVLFDASQAQETLEIGIGDSRKSAQVSAGVDELGFSSLTLPAGPLSLHATLAEGEKKRGVWQVELIKLP